MSSDGRRRLLRLLASAPLGFAFGRAVAAAAEPRRSRLWNVVTPECLASSAAQDLPPDDASQVLARQRAASPDDVARCRRWVTSLGVPVWNDLILDRIAARRTDPVKAARGLAILNTSMLDALVLSSRARSLGDRPAPFAAVTEVRRLDPTFPERCASPSEHAAIASAAGIVLGYLYPAQTVEIEGRTMTFAESMREATEAPVVLGACYVGDVEAGRRLGEAVGRAAVERARTDGSDAAWEPTSGHIPALAVKSLGLPERENPRPTGPAYWEPTPPAYLFPPLHPLAGNWRPWIVPSGSSVMPPPPPAAETPFPSRTFLKEAAEVRSVVRGITADQRKIATFWADNPGTITPPGHWARIALDTMRTRDIAPHEALRLMAWLGVGLADSALCCWAAKYRWWVVRPVTAIRTLSDQPFHDPNFESTVLTPPFPAYTSGHATFSGCASALLDAFLPGATVKDALGRSVSFRQAAEQAAESRLYGGIHYRSDNDQGLACGRRVAEAVLQMASQA